MLTYKKLRERLLYNYKTGIFIWKRRKVFRIQDKSWNTKWSGKETGCMRPSRLAWLYIYKTWPKNEVDHINCLPSDNRIVNLREATRSENAINRRLNSNNKSGYKGIWKRSRLNRWEAEICKNGKRCKLGGFPTPEEASEAYKAAARNLHGEFARP